MTGAPLLIKESFLPWSVVFSILMPKFHNFCQGMQTFEQSCMAIPHKEYCDQIPMLDGKTKFKSVFQIIQKVFIFRTLCKPFKFFRTKLIIACFYKAGFVDRGTVLLKLKRVFPKVLTPCWRCMFDTFTASGVQCNAVVPMTNPWTVFTFFLQTLLKCCKVLLAAVWCNAVDCVALCIVPQHGAVN